jgi:hypothetical protein
MMTSKFTRQARLPFVLAICAVQLCLDQPAAAGRPFGPFTNALSFNGSSQYVSIPNFGSIIPTNEITVEFWAYPNALAQQSAFMMQPDDSTNRFNCHVGYSNGNTYWDFGNITGSGRISGLNPPNGVGNWIHYALVASQGGNYMAIYTNGNLFLSNSAMTPFVRGAYDLRIGGNTNFFFNGQIDEFRVWSVARTQAQIQSDYSNPLVGNETNLLVYYKFDSASGTVATNSAVATGAAFNGTLVNGPAWVPGPLIKLVVNTNDDGSAGSLRQVVATASFGATVNFSPSLSGQTILLTNGPILLTNRVTIDASALANGIQINGNSNSCVFVVSNGVIATLTALTVTNGYDATGNFSGGILNDGVLTLNRCVIAGNNAASDGGGVHNVSTLTVTNCSISNNVTGGDGGGFYNGGLGLLTVNNSTISGNTANGGFGAGLESEGTSTVTIFNSTVANNTTLAGEAGGGLFVGVNSTMTLVNCTVADNSSQGPGAGIFAAAGSTLNLTNAIVAGNSGSGTNDLIGAFGGGNNLTSGNPMLAPLANYGGFTETMPPLAGSPAIDAGADTVTSYLSADQRGYPRLSGAHVDIGAVEFVTPAVVTTTADSGAGSLRAAVNAAINHSLITFAPSLSGQVIRLGSGPITLHTNLTIDGSGLAGGIQINGNSNSCVFVVGNGITAAFNSLTIANGYDNTGNFGGGILNSGALALTQCLLVGNTAANGGGIYNSASGSITMSNCTLTGNSGTANGGGGIFNYGTLAINGCLFNANSGNGSYGGAAILSWGGSVTVNQSTVSSNTAANAIYGGGGIQSAATAMVISNCAIFGNSTTANGGGGVELSSGAMSIYNSTIAGNVASVLSGSLSGGGGVFSVGGTLVMVNCTVSGNSAGQGQGDGIYNYSGTLILTNTIVAGNTTANTNDFTGPVSGVNNITNGIPLLAPLGYYGGVTEAMPPLAGSPAIDAGDDAVASFLPTDQRGYPRLSGAHVDIGAVESQIPVLIITAPVGGEVFTNFNVTASGTANCVTGVGGVFVMDAGGSPVAATTSNDWATWTASVTVASNQSTIRAYAVNSNGVPSLTNGVAIDFPVVSTNETKGPFGKLVVQINPPGPAASPNKVSPNDNGKYLAIGSHVTLTAVPGHNQIFNYWFSGTNVPYTVSTNPTLRFVMQSNMVAEANFITNVFLAVQGSYFGLFAPTNGLRQQTNSGSINFSLTSTGSMSGKINIAGASTPISGKFTPVGVLTNVAHRPGGLPSLTNILVLDFTNQTATGSVSDGSFTSPLLANLNVFSAKEKAANFQGQYTLVVPGTTNAAVGPFGVSVATVKISSTGAVTFAGNLADGTAVTAASAIAADGVWPLYVPLYKGLGSFWSWNFFNTNGVVSSNQVPIALAAPSWISRGNTAKGALYAAGFTNQDALTFGSPYAPGKHPDLTDLNGDPVIAVGGNLLAPEGLKLALTGTAAGSNIVLTLTKSTGAVTGSFLDPVTGKKLKVTGVLLQNQTNVEGFFLGTNRSGAFGTAN